MQARQLPLNRGWAWLTEGVMLWRRNPGLATFVTFFSVLILLVVGSIPLFGEALAAIIMPAFTLSILNTFRHIDEGRKGTPDLLFSGFRRNLSALVTIGCIYLIGSLLTAHLAAIVDGGALQRIVDSAAKEPSAVIDYGEVLFSMSIAMLFALPVLLAYGFAPVLAGWWDVPPVKAMFFSFVASLRNWRAFLTYSVALTVVVVFASMILAFLSLVSLEIASLLTLVFIAALIPVGFASYYVIARDIFSPSQEVGLNYDDYA